LNGDKANVDPNGNVIAKKVGSDSLIYIVTNLGGCSFSVAKLVNVVALPVVTISGADSVCIGNDAVFTSNPVASLGTWKKSNLPFVGFVAEEYQTVDSGAVHGEANATQIIGNVVDDKGTIIHEGVVESSTILEGCTWVQTEVKPIYQTLEYGSAAWCANMTAFVQNLQTTISEMQTAILALQSK
jgi:hypothetical protein